MILEHFLLSINETNCYVIACSETKEAAIIDPGEWNEQIGSFIDEQELNLTRVLLTHAHGDHTGGIETIKNNYDVKVYGHDNGSHSDEALSEGACIEVGTLKVKVLETPGHTDDSITFVLGCDVFCGDLIFAGSIGGVSDKSEHDLEVKMIKDKILPLGDDMVLHPGHGPATTVQLERIYNPLLIP